jgi:hypothetical protein
LGGAYTFGGGTGWRAGSGLSLVRMALRVWTRGERSFSTNVVKLLGKSNGFFV